MYSKLYELLASRIGPDAAKLAVQSEYTNVALAAVVVVSILISRNGNGQASLELGLPIFLILLAGGAAIYARIRLAKAISKYLSLEIKWYSMASYSARMEKYDKWLESLSENSKK